MNKRISYEEKRRSPRIEKNIPLKIKDGDFDFITETKNISSIGAYCVTDRYIAPLTKIKITLLLPEGKKNDYQYLNLKGVVVRIEKQNNDLENKYNIAVFFNDINQTNKDKLNSYIQQHLQEINP